jgi:hypothetical protein
MNYFEFIGYAVCCFGGGMVLCCMILNLCKLGNMAVRGLIGWHGGWKVFLIYREWLADEEHKKFVAKMQSRTQKQETT